MNYFQTPLYQLYLLQLENYELRRFWKLLFTKGALPMGKTLRKRLVWTVKAKVLMLIATVLYAAALMAIVWLVRVWGVSWVAGFFAAALIALPAYFIFFTVAELFLYPVDALAKYGVVRKAKLKIGSLPNLKVIGIAGSYGKTTMKEVLKQVLGSRFQVQATPESYNLPLSVSRFILKNVTAETELLILEFGEHYQGDIRELCKIAPPDISVITGINEAHFERMKSLGVISATIFEAVQYAKSNAMVVVNGDDDRIMEQYRKFIKPGQSVETFQISNFKFQKFNQATLQWEGEMEGLGNITIRMLGRYALGDAAAAIAIARSIGLTDQEIRRGLLNVKPVEHRLQPITSAADVLVIDDSYNGNPDGVREAIEVLSRFGGRRKVYLTPGLVESGSVTEAVHKKIGEQLAGVADVVILIKNSVTPFIEAGITEQESRNTEHRTGITEHRTQNTEHRSRNTDHGTQIIWFNTAQEAHESLKNILKPGDVILFQNDWGDQYI